MQDKHISESGRTMVEVLGVVAIIGVLSVGGMALSEHIIDRIKANRIVSGLQERIVLAMKRRTIGKSTTFRDRQIQESILGLYPVSYEKGVSDNTIPIYFGKKITVSGLSQEVCEALKEDEVLLGTLNEINGVVSFNDGGEDGSCIEGDNNFFVLFGGRNEGKCYGRGNNCLECDETTGDWVVDESMNGRQVQDSCHICSDGRIVAKDKGRIKPCGSNCCSVFETCSSDLECVTHCPTNSSVDYVAGNQIGDSDCYCFEDYRVDAFQTGCIYSPTCTDEECSSENECMRCNSEVGICENKCQSVEYLEATGAQWMDTGITITVTDNFTANYMVTLEKRSTRGLIGYSPANNGYWGINAKNDYEFGGSTTNIPTGEKDSVIFKRTIDTNGKQFHELYINGVSGRTQDRATGETGKFSLWAIANGTYKVSGKIYSFQMTLNGENVRNFVPVLDPDGVPAMFDQISKTLYYNSGTGSFKTNLD